MQMLIWFALGGRYLGDTGIEPRPARNIRKLPILIARMVSLIPVDIIKPGDFS
jgi:hypothetical protein